MKKVLFFIIGFGLCLGELSAQVPQILKYQAILRDASGSLIVSQNKTVIVNILQGGASGTTVFTETHNVITSNMGLISLNIGSLDTLAFEAINWASGPYFLKITVDGTVMGTSQLLSVPFALYAKTAANAFNGDYNNLTNKPDLSVYLTSESDGDSTNDLQALYLSHDTLYLSKGGKVYLGYLLDNTDSQHLSLNGNYLSISNGNEVRLPSVWEKTDSDIVYDEGKVSIGNVNGTTELELHDDYFSGGRNLVIGDDSYLSDIDMLNTLGIYGNTDSTQGAVKLGANGPVITGKNGNLGISQGSPQSKLDVNGEISAEGGKSSDWNMAYSWGNHAGFYRPIDYVPAWSEITGKPTFATVATSGSYNDLTDKPTTDGSETKVTAGTNITVTGTGTNVSPYLINSRSTHYIGELYGGGVVFYVDYTGQHGLIASPQDISTASIWSNIDNKPIGATSESPWDGENNTSAITGQAGHTTSAALLCQNYNGGSFNDRYLPAIDELNKLANAKYEVDKALGVNGITVNFYWSSTENDDYSAWRWTMNTQGNAAVNKGTNSGVRAIRAY